MDARTRIDGRVSVGQVYVCPIYPGHEEGRMPDTFDSIRDARLFAAGQDWPSCVDTILFRSIKTGNVVGALNLI